MKTPEQIVKKVFKRWGKEVAPAWGDGYYTPSDDQFAEMAVEAIQADRAQRIPGGDLVVDEVDTESLASQLHHKDHGRYLTKREVIVHHLSSALQSYRSAVKSFTKAANKAEKKGDEIPSEAYYDRDDTAVYFAEYAEPAVVRYLAALELLPAAEAALAEFASPDPARSTTEHYADKAPAIRQALENLVKGLTQ